MPYQGFEDYFEKPAILSVATTGGLHGKEANPNLPTQPEAVARDVAACEAAGASMVHLHARDEDDQDTKDLARFQALRDAIDAHCEDIVVNFTTGGGGIYPREERIAPVLETDPRPEVATIDVGPMNFGQTRTAINPREMSEEYAERMRAAGVKPEIELFNPGHLPEMENLIERGLLAEPYWATVVFGMQTGTPPHPRNLVNFAENLPPGTEWQALAVGRYQLPLTTMALTMGGHVRVGMEDNVYYRKGDPAESNAQLVERTARIAAELDRPLATPAETRGLLGL
jgi:3-keto-5-aminohexanoate cleavage enzyme